jgi:hypothetical protein
MKTATNTKEALYNYETALSNDDLIQLGWHKELDGRHLACALGILGDEVESPKQCPAQIMPRWLAQMVPAFFDRQGLGDAKIWGLNFYKALDRIGGIVQFSVIHDWHFATVCDLAIDVNKKNRRDVVPHIALKALHKKALHGEKISVDEWRPVLKATYADADADAYASAYADADAAAYAAAYADAYAAAYAAAYAEADAAAYADADAYASAYADADAAAAAYAEADAAAYADAWKKLANGMVDALNRVPA